MSAPQMPPWLQEQIGKLQQSQQNLQSIMTQRQHLEMEKDSRGAKSSISSPLSIAALTYSRPSARVYANSWVQVAPASNI